jgi:outer membrane lipoprotein LolB
MWRSERPGCLRCLAQVTAALLMSAGLAACAVPMPRPPDTASLAERIDAPRRWDGRFSVVMQSPGAEGRSEAAMGRFMLVSTPMPQGRELSLELRSPFGQILASGRHTRGGPSRLTLSDGRVLQADSLDAVLEQALGWPLPIERLPDWLDDRFDRITDRDAAGLVLAAQDSGWRIEREPLRWSLERDAPAGRLRVVLILDR